MELKLKVEAQSLNCDHRSIYSFQSLFVQRNKEKVVKAFFFQTIDARLDRCKNFLRP